MRPGDDVKPVLDKIKDTYARMAAAGSSVSQLQQCTKIISVLDNSWDNLIPTLNSQQDQWTPEWLRQQILQEDFRRRHVGGGAATKTAEGTTGPAKTPLALVHMDVVGPTRAPSLSGNRYFLTIVDDHTRAVWVYPLKSKGEVAAAVLKEWMPRAQRECGHKVKVIRSDNGGEFIGADFEGELKRKGIQHQLTVPYNPQQNGVAERFNRTLQEGARTLLGRKPNVVQAGSVVEQIEEDEIALCYWAAMPQPKLAKNACLHGLTKHIRPKWHWVRRLLDKEVRLEIVKTHQQAADIFTKRLAEADRWKGMKLAEMSVH
ncbi:hypothetical protein CLOP_g7599 [Closterium sp. NIES-67]|nr:hypothetical protein CLOP_g7599 [Closterium sp. NIES-67]